MLKNKQCMSPCFYHTQTTMNDIFHYNYPYVLYFKACSIAHIISKLLTNILKESVWIHYGAVRCRIQHMNIIKLVLII